MGKKKQSDGGAYVSKSGRPKSPNTVTAAAAAAGDTTTASSSGVGGGVSGITSGYNAVSHQANNTKSKKSKSNAIFIKPFEKPPELPPDFYDTSLDVLRRALTCVLRHEALTTDTTSMQIDGAPAGGTGTAERLIGREELYRSVEDLCVHKFGSKLYYDVVNIMKGAAGEVVHRLAAETASSSEDSADLNAIIFDSTNGDVGYNATSLINDLNLKDGGVCSGYDPTTSNEGEDDIELYSEKRYALLKRLHTTCRTSYAEEYLTFVRSIFLALDRAHVYLADAELDKVGGSSSLGVGGKVLERSAGAAFSSNNSTRVWGLWEVGIACLREHMLKQPTVGERMSDDAMVGDAAIFPVLTTMVLTTAHAILSEYDNRSLTFSSSYNVVAMSDIRPLVRNCVRTCVDLGALPNLLEELIIVASARFEKEGSWWSQALGESKKSAPEYLVHVEKRLRQGLGMTSYYLPSNAESGAALRGLSKSPCLTGAVPSSLGASVSTVKVTWSPANSSTRRILPAIIEKELLGPHIVPKGGILEQKHLHPMLDDDDGSSNNADAWKTHSGSSKTYENAKRLYGLCWRMTVSSPPAGTGPPQSNSGGSAQLPTQSALDHLRVAFGEYGRLRGSRIIKQGMSAGANSKELEKKVIPDLLEFKNHLYSLHTIAFRSDELFGNMLRSVLEDVLNGATSDDDGDGGRRIAELLAKHVDARFKDPKAQATATSKPTAAGSVPTDPSESFQSEILSLFRHINSKDVFEAFYKRDLAKRLLTNRTTSTDMERSFLSKLKAECGAGYTSKMEGMFKDMDLSRDIMGSYAAYASGATNAPSSSGKTVDMDVQVLTTGYWPVYPKYPNIILPPELLELRTKFDSYYNDKYQGRRIAWQYTLGNLIVKSTFPKCAGPRELIVNMCQSLVLLCFRNENGEDGRGLTLDEITKQTGIEDRGELGRVLQSLSMGREGTRVLRKVDYDSLTEKAAPSPSKASSDGNGSPRKKLKLRRNVGPFDRFIFNDKFSSNQRRIRITNITMKETSEERKKTHETVSKDRLYFIDAAVVRIMKARKTTDHRSLIGEVMAQLKFPVSNADIKKRIESLIEREYMERVEGDKSRYKYLA